MKKLIKALTGKTAMLITLAFVVLGNLLEIVTAIRTGYVYKVDWIALCMLYCMITIWAAGLEKKKKLA